MPIPFIDLKRFEERFLQRGTAKVTQISLTASFIGSVDTVLKLLTVMLQGESVNISTDYCCSVKTLQRKIIDHYAYTGKVLA